MNLPRAHLERLRPFTLKIDSKQLANKATGIVHSLTSVAETVGKLKPELKPTPEETLLRLQNVEGRAALNQSSCILPAMVHHDQLVRNEATAAKRQIKETWDALYTREDVYLVLKSLSTHHQQRFEEDPLLKRLYSRVIRLFERNGLGLSEEKRNQYRTLKAEITKLENEFQQNINENTTSVLFSREELRGCPEAFIDGLPRKSANSQQNPDQQEEEPLYVVSLKPADVLTVMQSAILPETRKRLLTVSHSQCQKVNVPILAQLVHTRHRAAQLLGFPSHAAFQLDINMAKSPEKVDAFLRKVLEQVKPVLHENVETLLQLKKAEWEKHVGEWGPFDGKLNLWDIGYYERILRKEKYSVDDDKVKEYFPLNSVLNRMLDIYQEIFHLKFVPVEEPNVTWSSDVLCYAVYDNGNASNSDLLGFFYLDLLPRDGKYSHQCVAPLAPSCVLSDDDEEKNVLPVVVNIGNLTKPTSSSPSLLKHSQVQTCFHELGHAIHAVVTSSPYLLFSWSWSVNPYPAGVEMDFLETPSQMLENWIWDPAVLKRLSSHFKTEEPLPDEMITGIIRTRNVNGGYKYSRQIFMSLYDMAIHGDASLDLAKGDIPAIETEMAQLWGKMQKECTGMDMIPGTMPAASWYHPAMGYDAGYYSYLWAEVYSHDLFTRFQQSDSGRGCFDSQIGSEYLEKILQPGATIDAIDMLRHFLGREPNEEAFLRALLP